MGVRNRSLCHRRIPVLGEPTTLLKQTNFVMVSLSNHVFVGR